MADFYPEMASSDHARAAVTAELSAVKDINYAFLQVLISPAAHATKQLLGLEAPVLDSLRNLSREQLRAIAAVPFLLVEFCELSAQPVPAGVAEPFAEIDLHWQYELRIFADRLFTCIWQAARNEQLVATLCAGLDAESLREFAAFNFRSISHYSAQAAHCLQARLAKHECVWPDLIRSVVSGSSEQQLASRLSVIQLSVVQRDVRSEILPAAQRYR